VKPDSIRKAAATLAGEVGSFHDARNEGAALGRALAAEMQAREIAAQLFIGSVALDMEMALLRLAASDDELVAEVADSALRVLRERNRLG
jgi:hypothetical protein